MAKVEFTAKERSRLEAKREAIWRLCDWGRSSRADARRYRRTMPESETYHAALARSFFFAAACLRAELKNEQKKLILKKLR